MNTSTPTTPSITVLMAVYNGAEHLAEAIQSVLDQTYRDFEFLIVNDASTDDTARILADFSGQDSRIRVLENSENIGLTKSLNRGLAEARGTYVARMDADDISLPHRFAVQKKFLDEHPGIACVGSGSHIIDEHGISHGTKQLPTDPVLVRFYLMLKNSIIHPSVMFRTATIRECGGYNETIRFAQDYDLWSRLVSRGHSIANTPEPLIYYRLHHHSITQGDTKDTAFAAATAITQRNMSAYVVYDQAAYDTLFLSIHKHRVNSLKNLLAIRHMLATFKKAYFAYEHLSPDIARQASAFVRLFSQQAFRWYSKHLLGL